MLKLAERVACTGDMRNINP